MPGVDAMVSVIAHELTETVTDPTLTAWWDRNTGYENADKCVYNYGKVYVNSAGENKQQIKVVRVQ